MTVAAVLLAAGRGIRFGGGKLLADVHGRPMAACAMDAMLSAPVQARFAVVSDAKVAQLAKARGIEVVMNEAPELGLSRSIRLGLERAAAYDAVLFMAADQPLLTAQSLERLIGAFGDHDEGLACLRDATHAGNPAVFSSMYYPALAALEGDRGAKGILRAHAAQVLHVDCTYPDELSDADDPQTLARILAGRAERKTE